MHKLSKLDSYMGNHKITIQLYKSCFKFGSLIQIYFLTLSSKNYRYIASVLKYILCTTCDVFFFLKITFFILISFK